ncbi:hypothetical protein STCU_10299 [Strigomonas culicis]|uniref:Uncharacterized protein n=1 Tax=Strigomonas culicis TaxID=28005 RepID=S9TIN6_9TRYP|nr:hypothetical protein STCU_10299 [Strigomonas culicis]|eukprot:EPY17947.1 hypothetical protein STCU_10299 [Strigomonas culicis]
MADDEGAAARCRPPGARSPASSARSGGRSCPPLRGGAAKNRAAEDRMPRLRKKKKICFLYREENGRKEKACAH